MPLVWWVKPDERVITVFRAGQPAGDYRDGDELDGEPVLPEVRLAVHDVFDL